MPTTLPSSGVAVATPGPIASGLDSQACALTLAQSLSLHDELSELEGVHS
jgi:hypothetical protein